jgi:MoaA/NifB/PqqE/SkfB family radical SAM enzyme
MEAAQALFQAKKRFTFATTLTRHNINETGFLLETARRYNTLVAFQPLKSLYRGVKDVGPLEPLQDDHGRVIDGLIRAKRGGNTHVRNSMVGLEHIRHWPKYPRLRCWAGKVFCILNTDGTLMPCDRIAYPAPLPDCSDVGFARALAALPDVHCGGCGFCGVLELNFLMSFKFDTVKSILAVLKK